MRVGYIQNRPCDDGVVFEWTIPEFYSLWKEKGRIYDSPEFHFLKNTWNLKMCISSSCSRLDQEWIGIQLWRCDCSTLKSAWYTFGVKNKDGKEQWRTPDLLVLENAQPEELSKFVPWSTLLSDKATLVPSNALTITCKLWKFEGLRKKDLRDGGPKEDSPLPSPLIGYHRSKINSSLTTATGPAAATPLKPRGTELKSDRFVSRETQTEELADGCARGQSLVCSETQTEDLAYDGAREDDRAHLGTRGGIIQQKHFKDMLLEGQDHDMTFRVEDREFRAHKCILRARSPVFAAMFTHNMKEVDSGDATIDDCDPTAFGEFLEYVYTGKVDSLTPSNALGLYYAGDKYDFPDLKELCVEFLKTSLSTNIVCDVINMAIKHNEQELRDCGMAFFTDHLMEILTSDEWQLFFKCYPILANELNVKAMKSYCKKI